MISFTSRQQGPRIVSCGTESVLQMGSSNKETVVFLHGLFGTPDHWASIMTELSDKYHVVAPQLPVDNQPGRRKNGVHTIGDLTASIAALIDSLKLDRFVLCGNSLGGLVSLDYSLQNPERVSGLVLAGSAGLYERSLTNGVRPKPTREFVRAVINDIFYNKELIDDDLVEEWYSYMRDRDYARFILRISRATRDRSVENELCQLRLPTMIVWGRNDEITPPSVAETFLSQIEGAQLRYLEQCGHAPNLEQPEEFTEILKEFLPNCFPRNATKSRIEQVHAK